MPIENRNLDEGAVLVATYKKEPARIVLRDGKFVIEQPDSLKGQEFKSPSAAGSAVMGGIACNGWRFWTLEGDAATSAPTAADTAPKAEKATKEPKEKKARAPRASGAAKVAKIASHQKAKTVNGKYQPIRVHASQTGVGDGFVRIVCDPCADLYLVELEEGIDPTKACPKGHERDDPQWQPDAETAARAVIASLPSGAEALAEASDAEPYHGETPLAVEMEAE